MDPILQQAGIDLASVAARNTAAVIFDRVRAARTRRQQDETIAELEGIVNDLIADKLELQRLAEVYRESLAAQTISADDLEFISTHLMPLLRELGGTEVEKFRPLLSGEFLRIAQALGFSFKQAVGQPLTDVAAAQIMARLAPRSTAPTPPRPKR